MLYYINHGKDITKHIKPLRLEGLPEDMRRALKERARSAAGARGTWAAASGLTQRHISGIESGKIVPRYDTLLELVRILDRDLLMVPRALVPVVQSLIRDHLRRITGRRRGTLPLRRRRRRETTQEPRDEV